MAATRGLLLASNRNMLVEYGGHVNINRAWAQSFLERMGYVKRKATTTNSKYSLTDFKQVKKQFLKKVAEIVVMEEIPHELVLNWDQTGLNVVPASVWTMDKQGTDLLQPLDVSVNKPAKSFLNRKFKEWYAEEIFK